MSNKPKKEEWEEEFEKELCCQVKHCMDCHSLDSKLLATDITKDKIKDFIYSILTEQREAVREEIKKLGSIKIGTDEEVVSREEVLSILTPKEQ